MEIAAFASFAVLVIAWLVLPLRVPTATLASGDTGSAGMDAQATSEVAAAA
ncbi:MAG TPA: hypothetical protein VM070_06415 [Candidatus Saccharimonadales bacterium]|nr:hypothetical protein [Candidatus Saccharimonadales bacterium]